jgi:hypothetical protein
MKNIKVGGNVAKYLAEQEKLMATKKFKKLPVHKQLMAMLEVARKYK